LSDWSCIKNDVIKNLYSIVEEEQLKATQMFKKLMLSIPNLPIYAAISTGIVPQLVKFLKNTTNSLLQVRNRLVFFICKSFQVLIEIGFVSLKLHGY